MTQFEFEAIGTHWQIDIYQDLSAIQKSTIDSLIQERIDTFDRTYSRFRADSVVTAMSQKTGDFVLPKDAKYLFSVYYDLYKKTNGYFTPLIGDVLSDAGYDATYSLQQKRELRVPLPWEEVMEYTSPTLTIKKPTLLDFGAGGKGYLVDLVSDVLIENDIHEYCIDAGGDILYKNQKPIVIGLEHPEDPTQVIGTYTLVNGSICGSAHNRRTWGTFTHIINPKTLGSATNVRAVWVIAPTAFIADAIATCLFFCSPDVLIKEYNFEYVIVYTDYSVKTSTNFSGELFILQCV